MNKGKSELLAIVLAVVIAFVAGVGGGVAGTFIYMKQADKETVSAEVIQPQTNQISIDVTEDTTIAEAIAKKVMPSVVGISTVSTQTYSGMSGFDFFFGGGGGGYSYDSTAVGTGVIVDEAGYILTNSHVVNDGDTKSITVSLYDGSEAEGSVLWNDATLDLAVVKIEKSGLVAAELGDSDTVNIGAYAAVIGNPLGLQFERSMSQGIISGLNRTITVSSDGSSSGATTMEGLIQTDATINSGNSGGPLLNSKGQVIGINSAKASNGEGMGFAIPINTAKPIVEQVKNTGEFARAYIGIYGIGLEEQNQYSSAQLEEYFGTTSGIYVSKLTENGGAEAAGIRTGDIIKTVDGTEVTTMNRINTILVKHAIGDEVEVTYMRDKKEASCTVRLTAEVPAKIILDSNSRKN